VCPEATGSMAAPACHAPVRTRGCDCRLLSLVGALGSQDVRAALLDLLINIMVTNSSFINSCLQMLTQSMLPPLGLPLDELDPSSSTTSQPGDPWQPNQQASGIQDQVVAALQRVRGSPHACCHLIVSELDLSWLRGRSAGCAWGHTRDPPLGWPGSIRDGTRPHTPDVVLLPPC